MHRVKNESGGGEGNDSWTRFSAPRGSNKYIKGVKHRNRKVPRPRDCIQFADPLQPAYRSLSGGHSLRVFICPTNAAPTTLRLYPCDDIDTEVVDETIHLATNCSIPTGRRRLWILGYREDATSGAERK